MLLVYYFEHFSNNKGQQYIYFYKSDILTDSIKGTEVDLVNEIIVEQYHYRRIQ
jgi:hypothetical protein